MRRISALLFYLSISALCSCGYSFQGAGSVLPADVRRIYIPMAENNSTETSLTSLVTESLRDQFEKYGVVTVVDSLSDSDAVLRSKILALKRNTSSVTSASNSAAQQELVMTLAAELRRTSGPVLWRDNALSVTKVYGSASGTVVTSSADFSTGLIGASDVANLENRELSRGQEQQAMESLADDLALKVYDEAVAPDF